MQGNVKLLSCQQRQTQGMVKEVVPDATDVAEGGEVKVWGSLQPTCTHPASAVQRKTFTNVLYQAGAELVKALQLATWRTRLQSVIWPCCWRRAMSCVHHDSTAESLRPLHRLPSVQLRLTLTYSAAAAGGPHVQQE